MENLIFIYQFNIFIEVSILVNFNYTIKSWIYVFHSYNYCMFLFFFRFFHRSRRCIHFSTPEGSWRTDDTSLLHILSLLISVIKFKICNNFTIILLFIILELFLRFCNSSSSTIMNSSIAAFIFFIFCLLCTSYICILFVFFPTSFTLP